MKVIEKVYSNERPQNIEYDKNHVYVNSNIHMATEEEKFNMDIPTDTPIYCYTSTEYEKNEYIGITAQQLNGLSFKVDDGVLVVVVPD